MRISKTIQKYAFAAVLIGLVTLVDARVTHAWITTDTSEALVNNPDGGEGLELAIADILDAYRGQPHIIVGEILKAAAAASDEQMVAIGKALAAKAHELAGTDLSESRAVAAAVFATRNPKLLTPFKAAGGLPEPNPSNLPVPTGGNKGGLQKTSPC